MKTNVSFLNELPRSDTLFGALCWGIKWVFGENDLIKLLEYFEKEEPPFFISSSFPYAFYEGKLIHLLPKPILPPPKIEPQILEEIDIIKRYRKVRYVTAEVFNQIISGKLTDELILNALFCEEEKFFIRDGCVCMHSLDFPVINHESRFRNAINRLSGTVDEGKLFLSHEVSASNGAYFLIKFVKPGYKDLIKGAIMFLADKGIGGDASVGRGQFEPELSDDVLITEPEASTHFLTLSLFYPSTEDIEFLSKNRGNFWYNLVKRKGRIESMYLRTPNVWKQTTLNLAEGSVLPIDGDRMVYGSVPIVKAEPFNIYQNGYAYTVRIKYELQT